MRAWWKRTEWSEDVGQVVPAVPFFDAGVSILFTVGGGCLLADYALNRQHRMFHLWWDLGEAAFFASAMIVFLSILAASRLRQGPTPQATVPSATPTTNAVQAGRRSALFLSLFAIVYLALFFKSSSSVVVGVILGAAIMNAAYVQILRHWERKWQTMVVVPVRWRFRSNLYFAPSSWAHESPGPPSRNRR